ncbi:MAG: signal peptidase I [Bdellovibrionales bacterium]
MNDKPVKPETKQMSANQQAPDKTSDAKTHNEKAKEAPLTAKEEAKEFFKTAVIAVILAVIIRSLLFEPFNIPSGSMKPTLQVGDYLFVQKPAYGYSRYSFPFGIAPIEGRIMEKDPKRGDVVVFKLPSNPRIDYIKRIIGLPGDTVQVKRGKLFLNGEEVPREAVGIKKLQDEYLGEVTVYEYIQTLPDGTMFSIYEDSDSEPLDNTQLFTVPDGHYFMMGDNRDNSQDSRVTNSVGFVPYENFVGRADFIFFSTNGHARIFEIWKWPWTIRYDRIFGDIDPTRPKS